MHKLSLIALCSLVVLACDKGGSGGSGGSASSAPDCEKVVEQIASLNPPDMRGEPEKKLWRAMCAEMKPEEKTCVVGAKTMDDMKKCIKK